MTDEYKISFNGGTLLINKNVESSVLVTFKKTIGNTAVIDVDFLTEKQVEKFRNMNGRAIKKFRKEHGLE